MESSVGMVDFLGSGFFTEIVFGTSPERILAISTLESIIDNLIKRASNEICGC